MLPRRDSAITHTSASHPVVAPLLRLCVNGVGLLLMHDLDAWVAFCKHKGISEEGVLAEADDRHFPV